MHITRLVACLVVVVGAIDTGAVAARQLASRPAEEWTKVLDATNRVASLRIDEIVPKLQLAAWMTAAGFRQSDDVKLFTDRYFLVYSKR